MSSVGMRLRSGGLEVLGPAIGATPPSVHEAFSAMVNIETVPIARVLRRAERAYDEVNKLWLARSRECGIFATDGSFLAAGSMKLGWFRVCLTPQTDLSLMADEQGDIEFLARASDGREVCGVTTEGSEFWIVVISMTRR